VQDSLPRAGSVARSFAIAFDVVFEKLCAGTNTNCGKASGSCLLPGNRLQPPRIAPWNMNCCASQGALLFCCDAGSDSSYYSHLSVDAFAVTWPALRCRLRLPIYADLLDIFSGSSGDAWRPPRKLVGTQAPGALSTLGWMWVRSGAAAPGGRVSK
jgi:hypothetical protein